MVNSITFQSFELFDFTWRNVWRWLQAEGQGGKGQAKRFKFNDPKIFVGTRVSGQWRDVVDRLLLPSKRPTRLV